jgi:hypothetical protein
MKKQFTVLALVAVALLMLAAQIRPRPVAAKNLTSATPLTNAAAVDDSEIKTAKGRTSPGSSKG